MKKNIAWMILGVVLLISGGYRLITAIDNTRDEQVAQAEPNANEASSASSSSSSASTSASSKPESSNEAAPESKSVVTYQSILDEYTEKIRAATPGLIEEYNNEAEQNTDGLMGLAELSNSKIAKLAEISNDGIGEMAKVMLHTGSGKHDEYEEWAGKLQDVYMEEAGKITEAYMKSAT